MGVITSRFRENKSTIEVLETIDKDIKRLQRSRRENQEQQKRVAASLLLYSVVVYIVAVVVFYFFYWPDTWKKRALYSLPLLVFPLVIWSTRKLLHWYFFKRLTANELAVNELREKKKLILEDVMEKETYKKAREILEKFDPARFKKLEKTESPASGTQGTVVRQRVMPVSPTVVSPPTLRPGPTPTPTPQWSGRQPFTPAGRGRGAPTPGMGPPIRYSPPPGPPMPRTVLPRERGAMEKLLDFVVGDGPQNRYALVCHYCKSHNGMALPEEFEYLSFRCCYCYNMNQARKTRPFAPRLEFPEVPPTPRPSAGPGSTTSTKASDAENKEGGEGEERCDVSGSASDSDTASPNGGPSVTAGGVSQNGSSEAEESGRPAGSQAALSSSLSLSSSSAATAAPEGKVARPDRQETLSPAAVTEKTSES